MLEDLTFSGRRVEALAEFEHPGVLSLDALIGVVSSTLHQFSQLAQRHAELLALLFVSRRTSNSSSLLTHRYTDCHVPRSR